MTRALIFGTFDHLHPGHRFVIEEAMKRGETFIVVARDETVQRIKGKRPRQSQDERLHVVENTYPSTHSILGDLEDYLTPVREVKPDLILLGYDQGLPPGVEMKDLHCVVERLPPFKPETYKSSFQGGSAPKISG